MDAADMTGMLFGGFPDPVVETTGLKPPRRKVKDRHARKLAAGVHPITGLKLADNGETCGSCEHRVSVSGGNRNYPKCDLTPMSRSETSDTRAWFPACTSWEPRK
jgi:hypothetical protein